MYVYRALRILNATMHCNSNSKSNNWDKRTVQ